MTSPVLTPPIRRVYTPLLSNSVPVWRLRTGALDRVIGYLLLAFAFILPSDLRLSGDRSLAMRLGYACLLLGIAGVMKRKSIVLPRLGHWLLLGFVAWSALTLAWAHFPDAAQYQILRYSIMFAVTAIIPQYAWDDRVRARLMDAYLAGCYFGIIGTGINFATGRTYAPGGTVDLDQMQGRYSFGTDPNYLALALVIGVPLALYRSGKVKAGWQKAFTLLYVPAAMIGVVLTGSRGAMVALVALLVAYALFSNSRTRMLLLVGVGACVVFGAVFPTQISDRFATIPDQLRYGTLSDRRELWDRGTAIAEEYPLQGIGAGAAAGALDIAAHNTPLELMMEGGAVSLLLFYGAVLLGFKQAWRGGHQELVALIGAWSAWFVGGMSLSWETETVTWFLFALLFSAGAARTASFELRTDRHARSGRANSALATEEQ